MSAARCRVAFGDDDVRVDFRFAVFQRDIADEQNYFDLFVNFIFVIILFFQIEKPDRNALKRADCPKAARAQIVFSAKSSKPFITSSPASKIMA